MTTPVGLCGKPRVFWHIITPEQDLPKLGVAYVQAFGV